MRGSLLLLPAVATAVNILISNDDGWAELNIRQLYQALDDKGFSSIISAPAENQSGRGSSDAAPTTVDSNGCEFNSCPPGSPPTGNNASETRFNVSSEHSYWLPNTADTSVVCELLPGDISQVRSQHILSADLWRQTGSCRCGFVMQEVRWDHGDADKRAGFNVGANLDIAVPFSGTVGAATEAAKEGIPAIAFSGTTGDQISWESSVPNYARVYANLSAIVTDALVESGKPYLPPNIWLNVNFPASTDSACTDPDDYAFVLTRISPALPIISGDDVNICGNEGRLPTERSVVSSPGCFVSISVGAADSKLTASADEQKIVADRLQGILSCLPSDECTETSPDL